MSGMNRIYRAMGGAYRPFPPALRLASCFVPGCRSELLKSVLPLLEATWNPLLGHILRLSQVPTASLQLLRDSRSSPRSQHHPWHLAPRALSPLQVLLYCPRTPSFHRRRDNSPITPTRSLQRRRAVKECRCYLGPSLHLHILRTAGRLVSYSQFSCYA